MGTKCDGDHLSMGTNCLGDLMSLGTKWTGTICPSGPNGSGDQVSWGPNVSQPNSYLWFEQMSHTRTHSFKCNCSKKEYEQNNIWVDGSDVNDNGIFSDAFDDTKIYHDPGQKKAKCNRCIEG